VIGVYLLAKYAAYTLWCWVGLWWLHPSRSRRPVAALALGAVRLAMGAIVGLFVFLLAYFVRNSSGSDAFTYLGVYVPVRIVEYERRQELWLGSEFGPSSFSAQLAPDGSIGDATFWSCPIFPQQFSCPGAAPLAASLTDCGGNAVLVPSAASCFEQHGGALRLELAGAPGAYTALVSQRGGAPSDDRNLLRLR
jgi:hypothetical protein